MGWIEREHSESAKNMNSHTCDVVITSLYRMYPVRPDLIEWCQSIYFILFSGSF